MRFKNKVLDDLNQAQNIAQRAQIQVNRGGTQQEVLDTIEQLKEHIENIKELVSVEDDEFAQQFSGN
jgi:hypothetical protein